MALLLKGGHLVDPAAGIDGVFDVVIRNGKVVEVGTDLTIEKGITKDCTGKTIVPGLVDIHVHLREPGREDKETVASGTRAAARGGFTSICPMPNTNPICDDAQVIKFILDTTAATGVVKVHPIGALTHKCEGRTMAPMGEMIDAGAVAFSDDGHGVQDTMTLRQVMEYSTHFKAPVICHCEDEGLVGSGVVNEGVASSRLGMDGWPNAGEDIAVARDIALAELTGAKLHIAHCSTAGSIDLIRSAKARGVNVTCEVTPHHLFLTEDALDGNYDTNFKMNPPLRTQADCDAILAGIIDGTVDAIATDHAPHTPQDKEFEFELAPFGVVGLETALSLVLTKLVKTGKITTARMVELMSINPREIVGIEKVSFVEGSTADFTVYDIEASYIVDPTDFASKSKNSSFIGAELYGKVTDVYVDGYAVLEDGKLIV